MKQTPLDELFVNLVDPDAIVRVPETWMQGRTAYGGFTTALAVRALRERELGEDRAVRTVTVQFLGPLGDGGARVSTRTLREGRSMRFASAEVHEGEKLRAVVQVAAGVGRASNIRVPAMPRPEVPGPEVGQPLPFVPGITPNFTQQLEYHPRDGGFPFSGVDGSTIAGWVRLRQPPAHPVDHAVALMDAWPSPVLQQYRQPGPASSVTWTLHLLDLPADPSGWWYYEGDTVAASEGYVVMRQRLWAPSGSLAAWGEQLQAVFDLPNKAP